MSRHSHRFCRLFLGGLLVAGAAFFLLPLGIGVIHIGMLYPAAILLVLAAAVFLSSQTKRLLSTRWGKVLAASFLVALSILCATLLSMVHAALDRPQETEPVTVVVLGCQVRDTQPSIMLQGRIDAAYAYLTDHPDAVCIASGGQSPGGLISEAECIRNDLIRQGIAPERILMEARSTSTAENIAFTAQIIRAKHLPTTIAVASDNFHQYRADLLAREQDLSARSLGCSSPWYLSAGYWFREIPAILMTKLQSA